MSDALMGVLADARTRILEPKLRPALESYAQGVYGPLAEKLGWSEAEGEGPAVRAERVALLHFLADTARDPEVRNEGARLGKAYANLEQDSFDAAAVAPDLSGLALSLETQEGGEPVREKLIARLANSADFAVRRRILGALGSLRDPVLTPGLLKLTFDRQLHQSERARLVFSQLMHEETRAAATVWLVAHWDALAAQIPDEAMAGLVRAVAALGCDANSVATAEGFLRPRAEKIDSASLELEQGLESARLCIARREAQAKSLDYFFAHPPPKH